MVEQRLVDMKYKLANGSRQPSDAEMADLIPQIRNALDRKIPATDYQIIALNVVGGVAVITLGITAAVATVPLTAILSIIGAVIGLLGIVYVNSQAYDYQEQKTTAQVIPDLRTLAETVATLVKEGILTKDQGAEIVRRATAVGEEVAKQGNPQNSESIGGSISQVLNSPVILIAVLLLAYNATKR